MLELDPGLSALGPEVVHGFTTRNGGVSEGPYRSLNLGGKWGDDPQAVQTNLERVAEAGGFSLDRLCTVRQVHGASVIRARERAPGSEADAIWTHRDDGPWVVGVYTADCVPVLLADRDQSVACAIHSGWRGTVAGVITSAVAALQDEGVRVEMLRAAIGPCIGVDAFEVGEEVAAQFEPRFVARDRGPKPHVNLEEVVREQLAVAGVAGIAKVGGCTHRDVSRYFSYRRDGRTTGQMLSFIGFR